MWSRQITVQKAFILASLLLASGISAAAIPVSVPDPASVSVAPTNTQVPTGQGDVSPASLPYEGVPDCQSCREGEDNEQTTDESAMQMKRESDTIAARTETKELTPEEKKAEEEEAKKLKQEAFEKCHGSAGCEAFYMLLHVM
ncbi:hypothetical protein AtubIFM55763_002685 [Aspergillus tubingensis]|uniref:Uncharacterized protein n=2 Tax=Aspergillus subgen. Circumdati TaxID=2720871 RepID=A0A100IMU2_ASPNG|nr:uncharacterized protein AtWU_10599 [Aspergillus tubingensis]GAQ44087.1 hypothetical protein AKAW_10876 [Aspergillus niger]GFN20792.1 hypothetical protein AtWU_10599 [Aspergillus tubingensis]GLA60950.1 hypothetical protein AtubIFM54640_001452 [Aspergillus tubingensis]GLA72163.1 hypothetical protein AtubIFM55763_002685 [Aspergillus tubingensis]GLA89082.1 hypothetical protein AtubIFM56815_003554 [Aspergillus tubingensis]